MQIRRALRRRRRSVAVLLALAGITCALALHHVAPSADMHGMSEAAACLAILAVGVAIMVVAAGPDAVPVRRAPRRSTPHAIVLARSPRPRPPRGGPLFLRLQVVRR